MISSSPPPQHRAFSLIEVMVSLMLLAVTLTVLLQLRGEAVGRASDGRSLAVASRLSLRMMHQIEAGRFTDLFDGFNGDLADDGYEDFTFVIGLGDSSLYSNNDIDTSSPEYAWRESARTREEERQEEDDSDDIKPEKTRVVITVTYPGYDGEEREYQLETLVDTWAVYQDFELYEELWASNNEKGEIQ